MQFCILEISSEEIRIAVRAESEDGKMIGDIVGEVRPGGSFFGFGFDELTEWGSVGILTAHRLNRIEAGTGWRPRPDKKAAMAHVFGIPVCELVPE